MLLWVVGPAGSWRRVECSRTASCADVYARLRREVPALFALSCRARPLPDDPAALLAAVVDAPEALLRLSLSCVGGKGGFGSMLKKKGMKVKVNNFESSRDLSGRRLREVELPARMQAYSDHVDWENALIQAFGGEDTHRNKKLSAMDALKLYKVRIDPSVSPDPFKIIEEKPKFENAFVSLAAQHVAPTMSPAGTTGQDHAARAEVADLDIDIDFP